MIAGYNAVSVLQFPNIICYKDDAMTSAELNQDQEDRVETRDSNLAAHYVPPKIDKMQPLAQVTGMIVVTGPV